MGPAHHGRAPIHEQNGSGRNGSGKAHRSLTCPWQRRSLLALRQGPLLIGQTSHIFWRKIQRVLFVILSRHLQEKWGCVPGIFQAFPQEFTFVLEALCAFFRFRHNCPFFTSFFHPFPTTDHAAFSRRQRYRTHEWSLDSPFTPLLAAS